MDIASSSDHILDSIKLEQKPKKQLSPAGQNEKYLYATYSSWNAAFNLLSTGMLTVIWPAQISNILQDSSKDDLYNGFIPAPGAFVSVLVSPIAGVASDYIQTRFGRRRLFIIVGSIIGAIAAICMAPFNITTGQKSVFYLMAIVCAAQFGSQMAAVPYLALLPDSIRPEKIGLASGWQGAASAVGSIIGTVPTGFLVDRASAGSGYFWPAYAFNVFMFILFVLPTVLFVKERPLPRTGGHPFKNIRQTYFNLPLAKYKSFYWTILTRVFFNMGVYSILPFLQFYMRDIIKEKNPATMASIALGVLILTSIPATVVAGHLSDTYGRKKMVFAGTGTMAVGMGILGLICFFPNLFAAFALAFCLGVGYGIYQAVDGALALDVLPKGASMARDFAYWHIALVIPNAIAPAIAGAVLNVTRRRHGDAIGYFTMSLLVSAWFIISYCCITLVDTSKGPTRHNDDTELNDSNKEMDDSNFSNFSNLSNSTTNLANSSALENSTSSLEDPNSSHVEEPI